MLRVSFTFIVIAMLVGCTSTPISPTEQTNPPNIIEPTTAEQSVTNAPSTESPVTENKTLPDQYTLQEYLSPQGVIRTMSRPRLMEWSGTPPSSRAR